MTNTEGKAVAATFGRTLRAQRQRVGLTQEALALGAGVDRTYISMLERGRRGPTLQLILRVGWILGCPAAQLVADTVISLDGRSRTTDR
jgi:transcriptional regulator with XRE-family HTH domain